MDRFGQNPFGEKLYRIVYSASRRNLVGGVWPDGYDGFRWAPTYPHIQPDAWVLERWLSPEEFAQVTREEWDSRFAGILGPFPSRGEYQHCHTFDAVGPVDANLDKLIMWIEEGRGRSYAEHREACAEAYEAETKDRRSQMDSVVRNALPAFGASPMSGYGGGRSQKSTPLRKFAEQIGFPVRGGKFMNIPRSNDGNSSVPDHR